MTGTILNEIAADYEASDQQGAKDMRPLAEELSENPPEIPAPNPVPQV